MGNCLRRQSAAKWAGEEWETPAKDEFFSDERGQGLREKGVKMEEKSLLGEKVGYSASSTEVKVKITKKQLEELLGRVDVKELTVEQVLAHLMNVSNQYETHQRSWRPALQSIPEVN